MSTTAHKYLRPAALALLLLAPASRAQTIVSDAPLSPARKKQVARMVEDIASAGWDKDFENGAPPNDELIHFGIYLTSLRNDKLFREGKGKQAGELRLSTRHVEDVARRYFGRVPRHHSIGKFRNSYDWTLRDGSYLGYSELFEQLSVEKVKFIRVLNARSNSMTVRADFVDGMATATSEPEREVVVKIQMTLRKAPDGRLIVWSYKRLSKRI